MVDIFQWEATTLASGTAEQHRQKRALTRGLNLVLITHPGVSSCWQEFDILHKSAFYPSLKLESATFACR